MAGGLLQPIDKRLDRGCAYDDGAMFVGRAMFVVSVSEFYRHWEVPKQALNSVGGPFAHGPAVRQASEYEWYGVGLT